MKRVLFLVAINLVPGFFIWVTVADIKDAIVKPGIYPFESEFFSPYSIYKSREVFIAFGIAEALALIGLVLSSITHKWKLYFVLLAISVLMIAYRMLFIQ